MTERSARIIRLIICLVAMLTLWRPHNGKRSGRESAFEGRELRCAISTGKNLRASLKYGLHYEMLQDFADRNCCSVVICEINDSTDYADSLKHGAFDIVAIRTDMDSSAIDGVTYSWSYDGSHAFIMSRKNQNEMRYLNRWLACLAANGELDTMKDMFSVNYDPVKKAAEGVRLRRLSPYDQIIRKYAATLGWDWRLLAALIYQESKFTINNVSPRGAVGLMQVMPSTARRYGIENLLDPEENIKAGTTNIRRIRDKYFNGDFEEADRDCFTLAAYNAGVGRISDCRKLAGHLGRNDRSWEDVRATIPHMRDDELLDTTDVVSHGHFNGSETIAYVDSVRELYDAFCIICPDRH